jgi:mycofactocin precursor
MSDSPSEAAGEAGQATADGNDQVLVEDILVEEVSIDGMCGVY